MTLLTEAFVAVRPDMDKFGPEVKTRLGKIDLSNEGKKAGTRFGVGFSKSLPGIGGRVTSFFKTGLGTAAAFAGGAVLGGGMVAGFKEALGQGDIKAKLQGQLGLSEDASAKAGKLAGDLYKANYGDSLGGVNDAIKSVIQNTNVSLNSVDLKPVTAKVLDLASTFDQDLGGVTRATGQLMRTGLAKNATEALDIITKGFQSGADKSEDFLDTLNEYGTQFRKLGIDGQTATGLISQGLKAGARDGDLVADSIKEFSIRAIDGSETTAAGFKAIGLDASKMAEQIAKGGKPAAAGLDAVFDRLRKIKDPVKQSQAAVALFGTQAEDLGQALFALDPSNAVKSIGDVAGAADKLDKTLGTTPQAVISGFFRTLKQGGIDALGGIIQAFASGEVKAHGLQGVLQTVAVRAREGFDIFRSEALPKLKEFAGFLTDTVAPVVATFVSDLAKTLAPAVKDIFGFFKTEVLPRLKDFAGFLGTSVLPKVGELATSLSKNKDFLVPFAGTILAVVAGLKIWAVVQGILNVVLAANPIGLVVLAIAALVAGVIWAFKNVGWFHDAIVGAFRGIQSAAKLFAPLVKAAIDIVIGVFSLWWNYYAKPILKLFWEALKFAWEKAQFFGTAVVAAFNAIKEPARAAIAFVVRHFLDFVGTILEGAAKAFGWVPNLGEKLKTASKEFNTFKQNTNDALAGINDQTVKITPIVLAAQTNRRTNNQNRTDRAGVTYATGGGVFGAGTGTSDSIPAMLSNGEHVWTAREVSAAGGHGAMESMRKAVVGFAAGGAVGVKVKPSFPPLEGPINGIARVAVAVAKPIAQTLANQLISANGPAGPPGSVRSFRGEKLNARTIGMLLSAEKILGHVFNIMQGSYSTRVAASGGTHAGGGVMDTDGPGGWNTAVSALRRVGFAAWHRTPAQGPWGHHIHSVAIGDPTESGAAKRQVQSYLHGGDGLGHGMAGGGAVGDLLKSIPRYDRGGAWPTGTLGINTSGKTETVVSGNGEVRLDDHTLNALERSQEKAMVRALQKGQLRMVNAGGGSYILQMSNG